MAIYYIADLHFGHCNIISYCNRPFSSVEEMDKALIQNWNSIVNKNDVVWVLGDISLGLKKEEIQKRISRLKGIKNLVKGNHDYYSDSFYREIGFHSVSKYPIIRDGFMMLSHEPLQMVAGPYFNIYGHVHDDKNYKDFTENSFCVSVERINYTPISEKEIIERVRTLDNH